MSESRSRSFTRGVHVSGLGGADASRFIGTGLVPRLEAVPNYVVQAPVDAGSTDAQTLGLLTRGSYVKGVINHVPLTGGTVAVSLVDPSGVAADIDLGQAIALNAAALDETGAFLTPTAEDRLVVATVTGGTAGETAILGLEVGVLKPNWR